jgi:hypothetical protein
MFNDEPLGPPRVWLRDLNVPGLCMTRSFGDAVAATVGVIDSPDVVTYPLKPEDRRAGLLCSFCREASAPQCARRGDAWTHSASLVRLSCSVTHPGSRFGI